MTIEIIPALYIKDGKNNFATFTARDVINILKKDRISATKFVRDNSHFALKEAMEFVDFLHINFPT